MAATKKKSAPKKTGAKAQTSSDLIDEQLARYREMRDFKVTSEPSGGQGRKKEKTEDEGGEFPFVVQKHAATRLHYDFRLGLHGVLKSWAVTKGPSYIPGDKRLAVQVEDHPMEYGGFEGTIPKGQYGGGTVMLWDEGTWEPVGDPDEGLAKGNLKFILHGKKLKGKWVLVRMGGRAANEAKPNWLLIKEHDEYERRPGDPSIIEEAPNSVITGRSMDAIAGDEDHVWQSHRPETKAPARGRANPYAIDRLRARKTAEPFRPKQLPAKREHLPDFIPPQLAKLGTEVPSGPDWIHELKLDGYRIQAQLQPAREGLSKVKLFSRNGLDWTHRMPAIADSLAKFNTEGAVLDGEVVVLTESGQTSFAELQAAFDQNKKNRLTYFVFDLLHLNGHNLRTLPLVDRKELLSELLQTLSDGDEIRYSQHLEGNGEAMFSEACRLGAEGIISKLGTAVYLSGRSSSWIKMKCVLEQEFVIGGFTLPSDGSDSIGALLLGYYQDGKLQYAGRTGTGFTHSSSRDVRAKLEKLRRDKSPFAEVPPEGRRDAIWVKPSAVAQVQFRAWTADDRVRQASFKGLREDKEPTEVVREGPSNGQGAMDEAKPRAAKSTKGRREATASSTHSGSASKRVEASQAARSISNGKAPANSPVIRVTHPEKIIDPESKLTKQALVDYYLAIADHMLPHIANRPLSIVRCPDGAGRQCFFQKHLGKGMPRGVEGIEVPNKDGEGSETYITLSTAEGLAGLAQMNVLEVHAWGSTNADLEHPDRIIFDLDPDEAVSWRTLSDAASEVRHRLHMLELKSFLKSTGGKGLHVVVPIRPEYDWNVIKAFTHAFTLQMESDNPKLYISKMSKAARKDKIFVDYLRNERGSTAISPYSSRARLGIAAALPLTWTDLKLSERPNLRIAEFAEWKSRLRRDPWKEMLELDQGIPAELLKSVTG